MFKSVWEQIISPLLNIPVHRRNKQWRQKEGRREARRKAGRKKTKRKTKMRNPRKKYPNWISIITSIKYRWVPGIVLRYFIAIAMFATSTDKRIHKINDYHYFYNYVIFHYYPLSVSLSLLFLSLALPSHVSSSSLFFKYHFSSWLHRDIFPSLSQALEVKLKRSTTRCEQLDDAEKHARTQYDKLQQDKTDIIKFLKDRCGTGLHFFVAHSKWFFFLSHMSEIYLSCWSMS